MDDARARELLQTERERVEQLLHEAVGDATEDSRASNETGDIADPAERLTAEGVDDAIAEGLRDRLAKIERAEARLRDGSYGKSVRSGVPISDERLEADPAAELTIEEATEE
jgi:DnaK suppressor protein